MYKCLSTSKHYEKGQRISERKAETGLHVPEAGGGQPPPPVLE